MASELHESFAIHPGPWLAEEIVKPYNLKVSSTANHLKVTRIALSRLLKGRTALTPDMAVRFEKAFGLSATTLLRMQSAYDLVQAKLISETLIIERLPELAQERFQS